MGEWQPIETADSDQVGLFWLEFADDCAPLNTNWPWEEGHVFMGKRSCWGYCYKATHWMPLPDAPRSGVETVDTPDTVERVARALCAPEPKIMRTGRANWTWRSECGGAWYISLNERAAAPYLRQIHVEAIVDLDARGLVAGIEIIDEKMPGPPLGVSAEPKRSE